MCKTVFIWMLSVLSVRAGLTKLDALSMIESGNNDRAIGGAGEVSRYQIKPQVWRRYSDSRAYRNLGVAAVVAEQHLAYLEARFQQLAGREPTDFDRYVMWNAGLAYYKKAGFSPARVHPVVRERAKRYENLRRMYIPAVQSFNTPASLLNSL